MDQLRIKRRMKWLVACCAIVLPGTGHYIGGHYNRATLLATSYILHLIIAYRIVVDTMEVQPLSIAFHILLFPCFYYYSVFDSLQQFAIDQQRKKRLIAGSMLTIGCIIAFAVCLLIPTEPMRKLSLQAINQLPSILLLFIVIYLLNQLHNQKHNYRYVGRVAASGGLLIIAGMLWLKSELPIPWRSWFIIFPTLLAFEIIVIVVRKLWTKHKEMLRVDVKGFFLCVFVLVICYGILEYSNYPTRWLKSFYGVADDRITMDEEEGFFFTHAPIKIALQEEIPSINVEHLNGELRLEYKEVEEIEIISTVIVQTEDEKLAEQVNINSRIDVNISNNIFIQSALHRYAGNRVPRMNITIRIPSHKVFSGKLNIKLQHGQVHIKDMELAEGAYIETDTARIQLYGMQADVVANSKRGSIYILNHNGTIKAQMKQGNIAIIDPQQDVKAITLNGAVYLSAKEVKGHLNIEATVGDVQIKLPRSGSYELNAQVTFGNIYPLPMMPLDEKTYHYRVGTGFYEVQAYASNHVIIE